MMMDKALLILILVTGLNVFAEDIKDTNCPNHKNQMFTYQDPQTVSDEAAAVVFADRDGQAPSEQPKTNK